VGLDNCHRGRHGILINNKPSPYVPSKKMTYFGHTRAGFQFNNASISSMPSFPHRGPSETPRANISICSANLAPSNNRDPAASLDKHNYHHRSVIIAQPPPQSLPPSSSWALRPNHHQELATTRLPTNNLHLEGPAERSESAEPADFAQGSEIAIARQLLLLKQVLFLP